MRTSRGAIPGVSVLLALVAGVAVADERTGNRFGPAGATKENLDLPLSVPGIELEEDPPDIVFFGEHRLEGDTFILALDRSSSMAQGELEIGKGEAIRVIGQLSDSSRFAVVFYDQGVIRFPGNGRPIQATSGNRAIAIGWVSTIVPGRGTCVREGLAVALEIAHRASTGSSAILVLADGGTTCPGHNAARYGMQTLSDVTRSNAGRHKIHVCCVGSDRVDVDFCQSLASMNGGSFTRRSN